MKCKLFSKQQFCYAHANLIATKTVELPYTPFVGLLIDTFKIEEITWESKKEIFLCSYYFQHQYGTMKELLTNQKKLEKAGFYTKVVKYELR